MAGPRLCCNKHHLQGHSQGPEREDGRSLHMCAARVRKLERQGEGGEHAVQGDILDGGQADDDVIQRADLGQGLRYDGRGLLGHPRQRTDFLPCTAPCLE